MIIILNKAVSHFLYAGEQTHFPQVNWLEFFLPRNRRWNLCYYYNMEWRIYISYKGRSYKAFKIQEGKNLDLQIFPYNSVVISRKQIQELSIGQNIIVEFDALRDEVDHFTLHNKSNTNPPRKHIRLKTPTKAHEPSVIEKGLDDLQDPIPLVTIVTSANQPNIEKPKKQWFGYILPEDIDYMIFDLVAFSKDGTFGINQQFKIQNDKKTLEFFDRKTIELNNCNIAIIARATNHELCNLPANIVFQQELGKSLVITRIEKGKVICQVSNVEVGKVVIK